MLTAELIRKIRGIEIRTRRLVKDSYAGEYHSVFKGRGMEFDEVRPYTPGDDVRSIDWNVTARMGQPYIKRYVEERELTVMLLVDLSASGDFGSVNRFKRDLAAELGAVLSFAATTNHDRVGLLVFTDRVELYIPPRKGRRHVLRLIRELLVFEPQGRGTNLSLALDTLNRILKRRAIVFLISDFLAPVDDYRRALHLANRRHDLIAVELSDPLENSLPRLGLLELQDAETGRILRVDTSSGAWQNAFRERTQALAEARRQLFLSSGVDALHISTAGEYEKPLTRFFQIRARRLRR